jgi:hypothetical protein
MDNKIIVNKHDEERLLLTEVLPYETPLTFSNFGLYKYLKRKDTKPALIEKIINNKDKETKPFHFNIVKANGDLRFLSVPHPSSQISISSLIFNNSDLLTSLCSRSNFSIRKPSSVASYYYEKNIFNKKIHDLSFKDVDVDQDCVRGDGEFSNTFNTENNFGSSFFSYSGYTLIYKFYDSLKFQSLEKKYKYFMKFDIAKCFNSIYTHSISWAVKSKSFAKENRELKSFDGEFDKLMRLANEGETNGIIVGPEFSRVFSEVILQRIDNLLEIRLEQLNLKHKVNYEAKRYVDDYFLFTNNDADSQIIYKEFKKILGDYKLFVNESKEVKEVRPFISNLTIAKNEVTELLNEFFKSIKKDNSDFKSNQTNDNLNSFLKNFDNSKFNAQEKSLVEFLDFIQTTRNKPSVSKQDTPSIQYIYKPYARSNNLINKFKGVVKSNNATYEGFSGIVFSIFRSRITKILGEIKNIKNMNEHSGTYKNFIIFTLDFLSFIYAMNIRVRTSFLFSQIIILINDLLIHLSAPDRIEIEKKIRDESRILMRQLHVDKKPSIEFINIIISIRSMFGKDIINDEAIFELFSIKGTCDHLNYFEMSSILYLCCLKDDNQDLCSRIYLSFQKKIKSTLLPINDTESVLLFLDLISFPNANKTICQEIIKDFYFKTNGYIPSTTQTNQIFNYLQKNRWFTDWSSKLNIKKILQRKEMQVGYH